MNDQSKHINRTRHIRDMLETEVYYPLNVLGVLRQEMTLDELAVIERFLDRCYDVRHPNDKENVHTRR